ncbi:hypothetical protein DCAR_0728612 [Daucus carota subsp. sativus]|uniref:BACK domain-containing protein n=1 Tax=Daucus carota subsp. sativus TaxID=79200 RepID=A0A161ZKZ1_DAUCS|nr:hypothetical protein DCAR_0728612 [Daucus carota subsp. sativus]
MSRSVSGSPPCVIRGSMSFSKSPIRSGSSPARSVTRSAATATCSMLEDWSGIDREKAKEYIISCQVASEDLVYDLILKWSRTQYPELEERQEILGSRLSRFIRFPYMSCRKLKKVLTCTDFDHELASKAQVHQFWNML